MVKGIHYICVDSVTKKIIGLGTCHDKNTFDSMPEQSGVDVVEFTGGILGQYFINETMVSSPAE